MACSIDVSPTQDCVILTIREAVTAAAMLLHNREAHLFGIQHGISRYLVDLRGCENTDSLTHNLHFALSEMPSGTIDEKARVALLVDAGDRTHDFIEAACRSGGLDVTLFNDRASAEAHLGIHAIRG
jgi:hypothetical protein